MNFDNFPKDHENYGLCRNCLRPPTDCDCIPDETWKQLCADIEYEVNREGHDYADNFRAYRYKDGWHKPAYLEREKRGCCGYATSHTTMDGDKWIIGWNWGH